MEERAREPRLRGHAVAAQHRVFSFVDVADGAVHVLPQPAPVFHRFGERSLWIEAVDDGSAKERRQLILRDIVCPARRRHHRPAAVTAIELVADAHQQRVGLDA